MNSPPSGRGGIGGTMDWRISGERGGTKSHTRILDEEGERIEVGHLDHERRESRGEEARRTTRGTLFSVRREGRMFSDNPCWKKARI
jgi:hypothetical protein